MRQLRFGTLLLLTIWALPATATVFVSSDGNCGGQTPCFSSLQSAADFATDGEVVLVAAGTYTGVNSVPIGGITYDQVILITKNLTLAGGYSAGDWTTPRPAVNVTSIDAENGGRPVSIVGDGTQTVTLSGLTLTGGNYTGLGNPTGVDDEECHTGDCGGGLYVFQATLLLRDSEVTSNVGSDTGEGDGGGIYLWQTGPGTVIQNCLIGDNWSGASGGEGGGLMIRSTADVTIRDCEFDGNSAGGGGGGIDVFEPSGLVEIVDTDFRANSSSPDPGGAVLSRLTAAGVALRLNRVTLRNSQGHNTVGSALHIVMAGSGATMVELSNVIFASNEPQTPGNRSPVVGLVGGAGGSIELIGRHLTWAEHPAMSALSVEAFLPQDVTVTLWNALIDTADNAFVLNQTTGTIALGHTNTMTNAVTNLHVIDGGAPTLIPVNPLTEDPLIDQHQRLGFGSQAIDAGVDAGVTDDIEQQSRPAGLGFDIGADEFSGLFADGFESAGTTRWSNAVP